MVTVVDAVNFTKDYEEAKYLQETGESLGEEESQFIEMFVFSIVTIPLYHSYLQMEFPDETPDFFYYFMGGGTLISVGCVLFYEIKKY